MRDRGVRHALLADGEGARVSMPASPIAARLEPLVELARSAMLTDR
jgi:hypothetical protein